MNICDGWWYPWTRIPLGWTLNERTNVDKLMQVERPKERASAREKERKVKGEVEIWESKRGRERARSTHFCRWIENWWDDVDEMGCTAPREVAGQVCRSECCFWKRGEVFLRKRVDQVAVKRKRARLGSFNVSSWFLLSGRENARYDRHWLIALICAMGR